MNFSSDNLEFILDSDDYIIETVKSIGIFNPGRWSETFGKPLAKKVNGKWKTPFTEAKILHTSKGLALAIKRFNVTPKKQTIEFAGLNGYSEKSRLLKELLSGLFSQLGNSFITRIDVAIDFRGRVPNKVIRQLCKNRQPKQYKNSIYYKTNKEKSTNQKLDIKKYNKSLKNDLDEQIERLEFVFKGGYFHKLQIIGLGNAYQKMEKSIKRLSGLNVKIEAI
ncbi:hypothetical protein Arnit_0616 [Arcobacter nitrofigilis DSM 7299]|uniref:Uncharacterized protein n=1 Tax=Arcobacter nitrofigilis (strain ATCC 33309 / DSM 7299 / CCUG 15893 / LMG 7604 / NCTC 12251 / CI) TaxID=572480 RepID=D5V248_ARCNC|nr:hypothetical protein [Arcobacter nitrofigilis]ADG92281.1 hypothetical protein Arnit_0616 [Arcobacter nitrofigilis DSM 7299]